MFLESLSHLLNSGPNIFSAFAFFLAALTSEIVAPLPSPLLLIGAAFFIKAPFSLVLLYKAIFYVVLPITLGSTLGAVVIYLVAFYGGKPVLEKFRKYLRFSWEDVEKFEKKMAEKNYDIFALFISRCIPLLPTTIANILAGLVRMNWFEYTVATFLGIFLRILLLLFVFHTFGHAIFLTGFNL